MISPTARTLAYLRKQGYLAAVVEKWVPGANIRQDLFGFADILAVYPGKVWQPSSGSGSSTVVKSKEFLLVQTTTAGNFSSRMKKAKGRPELGIWLQAGGKFEVHGWSKGPDGKWKVRVVMVMLEDLA